MKWFELLISAVLILSLLILFTVLLAIVLDDVKKPTPKNNYMQHVDTLQGEDLNQF
ncbi:hypothetical protein [Heyndrickxia sporothermodurans]|uniref:hypothetical protein n=1 Tax=Heyndrickxia sporothermodurans TaxID=46224 RepID=UPI0015E6EDBA|nr:hypothetical protein [Heyndrickxia sporothermodurans]